MQLRARAPVLDRRHLRHRLDDLQQSSERITLAAGEGVLKGDDRKPRRAGDTPEVLDRHFGTLSHREGPGRENEQGARAALGRHPRDARSLEAAFGVYAVHDREPRADLVFRDRQDAALLVERAGSDLGRVRVDGDCGETFHRGNIAQMRAEGRLVDRQVLVERQEHSRDHALGNPLRVARHSDSFTRPGYCNRG